MRHLVFAVAVLAVLGLAVAFEGPVRAQDQAKADIKVLFEKLADLPDKRVNVLVRHVTFPEGYKSKAHTHKGPGPRYVLKGQIEIVEGGQTSSFGAGEVFWESGLEMTAENIGGGDAELLIVELIPAGQ